MPCLTFGISWEVKAPSSRWFLKDESLANAGVDRLENQYHIDSDAGEMAAPLSGAPC